MADIKIIYEENKLIRLDKFLKNKEIEGLHSRSFIEKVIQNENVKVNGIVVKKSHKLQNGDLVEIDLLPPKKVDLNPMNMNLKIHFEDDDLAVVEKPAGIVTHPGKGNLENTLVNGLIYQLEHLSDFNGSDRPGIVHRLDKDTTGLLIVAKNNKTHAILSEMFANREIDKYYLTIVAGTPEPPEGTIDTHIRRSRKDPTKMFAADSGRKAISHYKVVKFYDFFSVVEIKLETGRTHQIRVHLSHINHPILGEQIYSNQKRILQYVPVEMHKKVKFLMGKHLKRQALHAYKLQFKHPINNEFMSFESELPEDFQYTLQWLDNNFLRNE